MTVSAPETTTIQLRKGNALPALFTLTIFLSASLLFFVQPLFAKLTLPVIGGAPAVWTTAMLFFQTVLIGGYLYAHMLVRFCPPRWQPGIHLAFWALGVLFLPLTIPHNWVFDPEGSVTLQTLWLFAAGVGVPFAVLSANAPLIQAWYRSSGAPSGDDPYFLYGASNLGSMAALLAFPLIAEPLFGAHAIGQGWTAGFIIFGICLTVITGFFFTRPLPERSSESETVSEDKTPRAIQADQIATWLMLAFVPSSLMLAITTKISTDMGTIPMIWIIPLALFLATFTLTFRQRAFLPDKWIKILHSIGVLCLIYIFSTSQLSKGSLLPLTGLLLAFFFIASYAHRQLYMTRPDARHLTVFYLVMSVGGAMGGLFNSVVAPVVFDALREGPATIALATLLPLFLSQPEPGKSISRIIWIFAAVALSAAVVLTFHTGYFAYLLVIPGVLLLLALLFSPHA